MDESFIPRWSFQQKRCETHSGFHIFLFSVVFSFVPVVDFHADGFGSERRAVVLCVVGSGFLYVAEAEVEHRDVAVHHDDVGKVRECPEVREIVAGDAAGDAECGDEYAEQAENGDERTGAGNTVPGDFRECNEAHDTGVCEEAEADGDHDHDEGLQEIRGQRMDGEQEFRIGACCLPFFRIQRPLVSHDDNEACHGADDVGIEEYAEGGNDALFARMVGFS